MLCRVGDGRSTLAMRAMIDRIVHHADVLTLKGASYRLRGRGIDSLPSIRTTTDQGES
jgi:DNA replication protein DnaC